MYEPSSSAADGPWSKGYGFASLKMMLFILISSTTIIVLLLIIITYCYCYCHCDNQRHDLSVCVLISRYMSCRTLVKGKEEAYMVERVRRTGQHEKPLHTLHTLRRLNSS